jgi:hypothetical protein
MVGFKQYDGERDRVEAAREALRAIPWIDQPSIAIDEERSAVRFDTINAPRDLSNGMQEAKELLEQAGFRPH